jgi:hypothetical protein
MEVSPLLGAGGAGVWHRDLTSFPCAGADDTCLHQTLIKGVAHSRCAPKTACGGTSPCVASPSASATYGRGVLAAGADTAKGEAKEAAAGAATKVFQTTSVVGEKIGSLADVIREKAPREGTVRIVATAVPILSVRGGP